MKINIGIRDITCEELYITISQRKKIVAGDVRTHLKELSRIITLWDHIWEDVIISEGHSEEEKESSLAENFVSRESFNLSDTRRHGAK